MKFKTNIFSPRLIQQCKNRLKNGAVGCVGQGNMGIPISEAVSKRHAEDTTKVLAYDPVPKTLAHVEFLKTLEALYQHPELKGVIVGKKPNDWKLIEKKALDVLRARGILVLSYMAGLGVDEVGADIVFMPNMCVSVGKSVMFAYARASVTEAQKLQVAELLKECGKIIWVDTPEQMHDGVAITGSAPGYWFLFMGERVAQLTASGMSRYDAISNVSREVWRLGAMQLGLSHAPLQEERLLRLANAYADAVDAFRLPKDLRQLAVGETLQGCAELVNEVLQNKQNVDFDVLLQSIMSPEGTTEAAIKALRAAHASRLGDKPLEESAMMLKALQAAKARSIEMRDDAIRRLNAATQNPSAFYSTASGIPSGTQTGQGFNSPSRF